MKTGIDRLGILAGQGELPYLAARRALEKGEDVRLFYFTKEDPPPEFREISLPVTITKMFQSVIRSMKREGVTRLILLGKAPREILYDNPSFDVKTLYILARMRNQSDYTIFEAFSNEFEKNGIHILPQDAYLDRVYLAEGRYGKKCTPEDLENIAFGMKHAREMNRLDIGQTVVVGKMAVLAVEAAEGTDRCIQRGGELSRKKGGVVCKVAKRNHDLRFDIPVTGFSTLERMHEGGLKILAIESNRTIVLHPEQFLDRAREYGITVVSLDPEKADPGILKLLNRKEAKWG